MPKGGIDVFACNRAFRDEAIKLREAHSSLVGLVVWLGFRREIVEYERLPRRHGKSGWSFQKKLKYLSDSAYSFSDLPVRLLFTGGVLGLIFALLLSLVLVVLRLSGRIGVPGYTPLVLISLFFGALNLLGLGIIGSYVWRTFENTKSRPLAIVRARQTFNRPD